MKTIAKFIDNRIDCNCRQVKENREKNHYCIAEVGSHYDEGKLPKWFLSKMKRMYGSDIVGSQTIYKDFPQGRRWFDHAGTLRECSCDVLVVEPYDLTFIDIEEIRRFAETFDLTFGISATSSHYPTRTLRVAFINIE